MTKKRHGNATHGIRAASLALQQGKPFDGQLREYYLEALDRRGFSDFELNGMGVLGDIVRNNCRLAAVVETIWAGILGAGKRGDINSYLTLIKEHGHRFDQLHRMLIKELELAARDNGVIDYEDILEAEDEDNQ